MTIRYECDRCGVSLGANDGQRYVVRIEIFAAAGPVELDLDSSKDAGQEMNNVLKTLASANPDDVEDRTYRNFRFDLCDACRKKVMERPLG